MKIVKSYCLYCDKETAHIIWTEDGYGASGISRIFSSLISLGTSNFDCHTYSKCISCGDISEIY